ncbi:MAG TPA: histidine kinase dimerization/phosphoacceptor domain -containing protein [Spirochaetia bacterium]|nr:histidine kinase dimerization/phosphoacceptor domain -containing protein [Spirochaetia bacterium]
MQQFSIIVKIVALLSYLVLSLVVLQSKAERNVRIYFFVYLVGMLFWQFTSLMVNFSTNAATALFWYNMIIAGSGTFNILFFPFTRAFIGVKGQKVLTYFGFAACLLMLVSGLLGYGWGRVVIGRGGYWVPVYDSSWLLIIGPIWYFFWFCGIYNLIRGLVTVKSPIQRNRILYVLMGAVLVIVAVSTNLTPLRDYPADICLNLLSAMTIGYAVVRYRLMDIRFVIARSVFYSAMTASLVAAYLGIVFGFEGFLKKGIGYSRPFYGVLATLLLALLFLPFRNLLQKILDRVFFREKADYQKALQAFSGAVTSLYDLDAIFLLIGSTIGGAIKTAHVSLLLLDQGKKAFVMRKLHGRDPAADGSVAIPEKSSLPRLLLREGKPLFREEALHDRERRSIVAENAPLFEGQDVSLVIPIVLNNQLLGSLDLGAKLSGTMYNDEDLRFLTTVANQAASAIEKSTIFHQIQRKLSEQTLLFILSEKFRGSADFDSLMESIVQMLKDFLSCEHCALVSFDRTGDARGYATDALSRKATESAAALRARIVDVPGPGQESLPMARGDIQDALDGRADLSPEEKALLGSLVYFPIRDGRDVLGVLALSNRTGLPGPDERELELLRTIRAIIAQGIVLHRTIVNLTSVKTYNENILDSLNDMGDTLIILDLDGTIKSVNKATCKVLGYREEELAGKPFSAILGRDETSSGVEGLRRLMSVGSISNREAEYLASDGRPIPMLMSGSVMTGEDGKTREVVAIARDMTEHRKAEDAAKNLLLIQEIHHRIKNNLQVISSLLFLQSGYVKDAETREMFKESQYRVRSMALLHERLYRSQSPKGMDFSEYIKDLTSNLFISYGVMPANIACDVKISGISLGMDTAVPCGLIVNELVSNSLKHAFPSGRDGEIQVIMERETPDTDAVDGEGWYRLTVADDGAGFPPGLDFRATNSLGLRLVCTLTDQLGGHIDLDNEKGTRFTITFREAGSGPKRRKPKAT